MERNLNESILDGDVVRIYGVSGKTGKSKNGFYYVSGAYSYANGSKHFSLVSLKTANGSKFEGIGKKTEYWPFEHCFSSRPDIRAEYMENVKGAKIENLGPLSLAVYSEFVNELKELEEGSKKHWVDNSERLEKVRDIVARMASENPALETTRKWREEHPVKLEGPGLRIARNGLDVREKNGTWTHYGLTINFEDGKGWRDGRKCVYIYGSWGHGSSSIPAGFALDVKNDTDSMTDYFDTDSARVFEDHPLYNAFKSVAQGGHAYTLTDSDAENIKTYIEAKKAAAEAAKKAEEEAERAEYAKNCRKFDEFAADSVRTWEDSFPWAPGCGPSVVVEWSEVGALHEGSEEDANGNGGVAKRYSVDAFDRITADLDRWMKEHDRGYYKVKFTVEFPDEMPSYTDRIDVGDGLGGVIGMLKSTVKYHEDKGEGGDVMTGFGGHSLDEVREVLRRLEEATDGEAREIDDFLDSLAG